jgi:hypothetical protein
MEKKNLLSLLFGRNILKKNDMVVLGGRTEIKRALILQLPIISLECTTEYEGSNIFFFSVFII